MRNIIYGVMILLLGTTGLFPATAAAADSFGPDNWEQYRLNGDKNAVFDNDSEPLEEQTFETGDEIRSTPVVVGNRLFVGNHNTGDLYAFDLTTGEKLWENQAPNWVHSEMIYHDGQLFVGFGNRYFQDNGIRGTEESGVLALDADSGDIQWKFNTDGEVMPTPAYYDGSVYAATGDKHLYQLKPVNGELEKKTRLGSTASMSSPNITDDSLYVGGSGPLPFTFSAYDLDAGEMKWQTEFPDVFAGLDDVPPAVTDGIVVTSALTGDSDDPEHWLYAMDSENGDILWKDSLGKGDFVKNNKSGAPIIYEGTIYVGSPITETFYAYDLKTGDKQWEFSSGLMKAPPVAKDDTVYLSNADGMVYALDAETGELTGEKELNGTLAPSGPIIMNDTLIVGSQDSNVYTVPLTNFDEPDSETKADEEQTGADTTANEDSNSIVPYVIIGILAVALIILVIMLVKQRNKR